MARVVGRVGQVAREIAGSTTFFLLSPAVVLVWGLGEEMCHGMRLVGRRTGSLISDRVLVN